MTFETDHSAVAQANEESIWRELLREVRGMRSECHSLSISMASMSAKFDQLAEAQRAQSSHGDRLTELETRFNEAEKWASKLETTQKNIIGYGLSVFGICVTVFLSFVMYVFAHLEWK